MWNYDDDEWAFLWLSAAFVAFSLFHYYQPLLSVPLLGKSYSIRDLLFILPVASLLPVLVALTRWADPQVRGHADYITLFMVGGAAWIFAAIWAMPLLGISLRDDALERNNPAALVAAGGIVGGISGIYALANVGVGPTIWTTLLPALGGTILLALLFLLIAFIGGSVIEAITIDRDISTALRFAGAMIGCSLILGRAAGGNWSSWGQTWRDLFLHGWPAALIAIAAGSIHRLQRPTLTRVRPALVTTGALPGALFVAAGALVVLLSEHPLHPSQW